MIRRRLGKLDTYGVNDAVGPILFRTLNVNFRGNIFPNKSVTKKLLDKGYEDSGIKSKNRASYNSDQQTGKFGRRRNFIQKLDQMSIPNSKLINQSSIYHVATHRATVRLSLPSSALTSPT